MKEKTIGIIKNLFFNFLGYGLNAIILQLFIIPQLSRKLNADIYGTFQTVISIFQFIPATISLSLNNLRLIINDEKKYENFSFLNIAGIILGILIGYFLLLVTKCRLNFFETSLFIIIIYLWTNSEYFIVEFRKKLKYEKIFLYNLSQCIGYLFGMMVSFYIEMPLVIYFGGMFFGYIYTKKVTKISREPIRKNKYYKKVRNEYVIFLTNNILINILGVCDRLIIMPMLGAKLVGVYTSATIFTKLVSLFISPINGIILAYISNQKKKNNKFFLKMLLFLLGIGIIGYIILFLCKNIILNLLYPIYANEAASYAFITIGIAMVQMINGVIGSFVLKYCSLKRQGLYNIFSLSIYFFIVLLKIKKFQIMAICYGILISNIIKLLLYVSLYFMSSFKEKEER